MSILRSYDARERKAGGEGEKEKECEALAIRRPFNDNHIK